MFKISNENLGKIQGEINEMVDFKFILMYITPILGFLVCYLYLKNTYEKMKSKFENDSQVLTCIIENIEKKPYDYSICSIPYILIVRDKFGGQVLNINYCVSIGRRGYTYHTIPKVGDEIKVISQNGELMPDYNLKTIGRYKKILLQYLILSIIILYAVLIFHKMILEAVILSILFCIVAVIEMLVFNYKTSHKE